MIKFKVFSRSAVVLFVIVMSLVLTPERKSLAQEPDCAAIDLSASIALLVDAQTQAAKGNTQDALKLIADAQAQLAAIAEQCGTAANPELSETAESANGSFSIGYPDGWQVIDAKSLIGGSNIPESVDYVAIASSETIREKLGNATPFDASDGLLLVLTGTRIDVARSLGVFGTDQNYDGLSMEELLAAYIKGASPSVKFGTVKATIINDQPAASSALQAAKQTQVIYDGVMLVTTFGEDQVLALFDFSAAGKTADAEALALAVAASLQVQ
ncbi:MAG: hypothetical protein KF726_22575 [Anaerolineae bacterium]|nr:hypothetical protein [Anaerolineae bacterium]